MKTHYYILVLALIFMSIPNTVEAQKKKSKSSTDLLIGTWTFDLPASRKKIEKSTKSKFDSLPKQHRSAMESLYRDRKLVFDARGNFKLTLADGRSSTGRWKLNDKKKEIVFATPEGIVFTQKIKKLSEAELVLKLMSTGEERAFISELHYTKTQK